jgi:formin-binding protein 1
MLNCCYFSPFSHIRFSSQVAFRCVLKELGDFAGQREIVAENLQSDVLQGITLLSKNLRDERKKSLNDGAHLTSSLNLQIQSLDRAKKNYEKAFRDSEKAIENYHKADADFNLSRAEVSCDNWNSCETRESRNTHTVQ